jgi:hypothetical protein
MDTRYTKNASAVFSLQYPIEILGELRAAEGRELVHALLQDQDVRVRRAAAGAASKLATQQAIGPLVKLMTDADPAVRCASLDALCRLREPRAVPRAIAALGDRAAELTALKCLGGLGGSEQTRAVAQLAKYTPSAEASSAALRILTAWQNRDGLTARKQQELDRAVAEVHGANGILTRWNVRGPVPAQSSSPLIERFATPGSPDRAPEWQQVFASGTQGRVPLASQAAQGAWWFAYTEVAVPEPTAVEFLASSSGSLQVWLNGRPLYRRDQPRNFQIDSDRFPGTLVERMNRLFVQVGAAEAASAFHLRFRRKSASAAHERLTQAALSRRGNPGKGQKHLLATADIEAHRPYPLSTMPEGLEPRFTEEEFLDLVAFLVSQKEGWAP